LSSQNQEETEAKTMKTGIQESDLVFPKSVPFASLVVLAKQRICKCIVSCKRGISAIGLLRFSHNASLSSVSRPYLDLGQAHQ
jgi:hypothetical protein